MLRIILTHCRYKVSSWKMGSDELFALTMPYLPCIVLLRLFFLCPSKTPWKTLMS